MVKLVIISQDVLMCLKCSIYFECFHSCHWDVLCNCKNIGLPMKLQVHLQLARMYFEFMEELPLPPLHGHRMLFL
jgi:hypothetical protein